MRRLTALAVVLVLAGTVTGCATSRKLFRRDAAPEAAAGDLEARDRILELQRRAAMTEVELERLRERVAELAEQLEGARDELAEAAAEPAAPPPSPPVVAPRIEETELVQVVPVESPPQAGAAAVPVSAAAQAVYDQGYTLYHQGRYVDAESRFQRFLQANPATELSDNAQYWIGEARFARGDYPGALAAFEEVATRYPEGNKLPDALLKQGQCLERLGDGARARSSYGEVMRRFPGSAAAAVAEERLGGTSG